MHIPTHLSLSEIEARAFSNKKGFPAVESYDLLPACNISVAPLTFGDTDFSKRRIFERPFSGACHETEYRSAPVRLYRIRDAVVHSSSGIVMVKLCEPGSSQTRLCLLDETIQYIDLAEHGININEKAGEFTVSSNKRSRLQQSAIHLLAPGGAYNYYHWNIDVVSRLSVLPDDHFNELFLVPPLNLQYQWDLLHGIAKNRAILLQAIDGAETVEVDELILIPNIGDFGRSPRSEQLRVFQSVARDIPTFDPHRRVYITRQNASHRRLVNEQDIINLLSKAGYAIIECEKLSLYEQIRLFSEASHIVAPHGAGLTNLVYGNSHVALCELQMDLNLNWLFRRLGSLNNLRYGCVVGENEGSWEPLSPHNKSWRIPMKRLEDTLADGGFI
ncbi:glycosyltransferase family 61 protein [Azospirillum sp. YIM DDC1]|uniref:Glycosyltransferase family 61 protein n=1 Tax=Azospirillum aestuarii TaxID=2802052 RepID=A0ABS1I6K8_9PROT|nr:glycosyltransferase family 61 protein [Azospirillum aestuarii]MBK4722716.1 glycosyltransferase family 61 protein [Azospirillum aestuarii]